MKTTYNERYKGKPFLRMLEFYFLDVIGHLDSTSRKFIQETEVKFCSVYGLEGDWKTVIRSVMEFPPHLDSVVLARWRLLEGKPVTPQEFVEQLIDSNWNT